MLLVLFKSHNEDVQIFVHAEWSYLLCFVYIPRVMNWAKYVYNCLDCLCLLCQLIVITEWYGWNYAFACLSTITSLKLVISACLRSISLYVACHLCSFCLSSCFLTDLSRSLNQNTASIFSQLLFISRATDLSSYFFLFVLFKSTIHCLVN